MNKTMDEETKYPKSECNFKLIIYNTYYRLFDDERTEHKRWSSKRKTRKRIERESLPHKWLVGCGKFAIISGRSEVTTNIGKETN